MNKETNQKKSFSFGFWSKDCVYLEIECFGWCESDWYFFGLDEMFFTGRRPTRGFWSGPRWTRRFFVLKRHTLYGYRDPEVSSLESTFFLLFFFCKSDVGLDRVHRRVPSVADLLEIDSNRFPFDAISILETDRRVSPTHMKLF